MREGELGDMGIEIGASEGVRKEFGEKTK